MKLCVLLLAIFFLPNLSAQDAADLDSQDQIEKIPSEKLTEESVPPVPTEKCTCPENEVQAQESLMPENRIFPPESVFIIAPYPAPVTEVQKEERPPKDDSRAPGYTEKLPRGYNNDTYKQIMREE